MYGRDYSGFALSFFQSDVLDAPTRTVTFVLPDYTAVRHTSAAKCGGVVPAQLTDYSAGGYIMGNLQTNPVQNAVVDTQSSVISQSSGSCGQYTGSDQTQVLIAGPGVNEAYYYQTRLVGDDPAYFDCPTSNCYYRGPNLRKLNSGLATHTWAQITS